MQNLHPKLSPSESSSNVATAQGSSSTNVCEKNPTRTMEQNKLLNLQKKFHITDLKHNIVGLPFLTKYMKITNSDIISLHAYNNSPYKIMLP